MKAKAPINDAEYGTAIAVYQAHYPLISQTRNLLECLCEDGWSVDFFHFHCQPDFADLSSLAAVYPALRLHSFVDAERRPAWPPVLEARTMRRALTLHAGDSSGDCATGMGRLRKRMQKGSAYLAERLRWKLGGVERFVPAAVRRRARRGLRERSAYAAAIGIENVGYVWAARECAPLRIPLVYYSLELRNARHHPWPPAVADLVLSLEAKVQQRAEAILVQDHLREQVLLETGHFGSRARVFHLPVGLMNHRGSAASPAVAGTPFDEMLRGKKLLLWFGALNPPYLSCEFVTAAQSLPPDWIAMIHCGPFFSPVLMQDLERRNESRKVLFSTRRLKDDEIGNLVSRACAGFVGYPADCDNNLHTGRSSEKAARYAWAGKPFVAVASPSFEEVVREYRCGVTIASVQELTQAVRQIESDYDTCCRGALLARDACYDFRRSYRPFGNWLESLRGQRVTR